MYILSSHPSIQPFDFDKINKIDGRLIYYYLFYAKLVYISHTPYMYILYCIVHTYPSMKKSYSRRGGGRGGRGKTGEKFERQGRKETFYRYFICFDDIFFSFSFSFFLSFPQKDIKCDWSWSKAKKNLFKPRFPSLLQTQLFSIYFILSIFSSPPTHVVPCRCRRQKHTRFKKKNPLFWNWYLSTVYLFIFFGIFKFFLTSWLFSLPRRRRRRRQTS